MESIVWDSRLPETIEDVISLLRRRVSIHKRWHAFILECPDDARNAVNAGVGTAESHTIYAAQYAAAINILEKK